MYESSFYTQTNIFFRSVAPRFESFKKKIKKLSKQHQIPFDDDVFMDTIIRCSETFKNESATETDIDFYFWTAFKQNNFSKISRNKFCDTVNLEDFGDNIIDEGYNTDIDEIIDLIKNEVKREFGEKIYNAWLLHICENMSYEELENNGYEGLNLHNEIRQIKRHILKKYAVKNLTLKNLLYENNLI